MRLLLLSVLLASPAVCAPMRFSSGETRTHLLELYSSEGCSSCPPAEAWLGSLRESPGLWRDFVPVAFHVNYWDRLGWPDRFASKTFTDREYAYASAWGSGSVYTPCFVLDGLEWRGGGQPPASSGEIAGVLAVERADTGAVHVGFAPNRKFDGEVHVAILGGGIASNVRAGENEGRVLHHEFIVLALQSAPLKNGAADLSSAVPAVSGVTRHALVVWITRRGDSLPLQATGGWLD
jgi:hypothetical protein